MGMGWGGRGFTNSLPNFSDPKSAVEGEIKTDGKEGGLQKTTRVDGGVEGVVGGEWGWGKGEGETGGGGRRGGGMQGLSF